MTLADISVIGPSGVGKSDYGEHAAVRITGCRFLDLDSLVRTRTGTPVSQLLPHIGNDAFLDLCQKETEALLFSPGGGVAIVAVGAGTLQADRAVLWLSQFSGSTVSVLASPEEVYRRGGQRNLKRSLEEFIGTEYSENRQTIYGIPNFQCSVAGLSLEEARDHFVETIEKIINAERDTRAVETER